jgi:hypothetical protein
LAKDKIFGRRLLLAIDAKGYGSGDDQQQHAVVTSLPKVLDAAATRAGLDRTTWARQPGGDGELAVLPPSESESEPVVVDGFVRELNSVLAEYNRNRQDAARLRLRLAVHNGVAIPAGEGFSGQGVVAVCRLVDSHAVKELLAQVLAADLAVVVSDRVFLDTVAQRHTSLRKEDFRKVTVRNKEFVEIAHLYLPGHDVNAVDLADAEAEPAEACPGRAEAATKTRKPAEVAGNHKVSTRVEAKDINVGGDWVIGQVVK